MYLWSPRVNKKLNDLDIYAAQLFHYKTKTKSFFEVLYKFLLYFIWMDRRKYNKHMYDTTQT